MKIMLALFLLFWLQGSFAQKADSTFLCNESNVYFQAIDQYLHFIEKDDKRTDTLFLQSGDKITDSILSKCRHTKLVKLDNKQLKNLLRERESLNLYRIMPLQAKNGKFSVALVPFGCGFNKTKKKYEFFNGGKYIAVFKFDGEQFVFQQFEEHGI
ncbi:MAG TPA: hypothetical protein VNS58_13735 [Puia sp.]|nr:hypothetical protein [Puia sp.]